MSDTWKSPTTIISIVAVLISISGNVFQYYTYRFEKEKWIVEEQNINQQKKDLQERLNVFLNEKHIEEQRAEELKNELDEISDKIKNLDKEISSAYFIAQMAASTMIDPNSTQEESDNAHDRVEAAQAKAKSMEIEKDKLVQEKKIKEIEYNKFVSH